METTGTVFKTTLASAILVAGFAVASPALACDMHGGGYGGFYGGSWQPMAPRVSVMDPAHMQTRIDEARSDMRAAPAKPSFSSVASRASEKALSRRAKAPEAKVKTASLKTKTPSGDQ